IPVSHRFVESPPVEISCDRPHQIGNEPEHLIGIAPIESTGLVLNVTIERRIGDVDQLRHTNDDLLSLARAIGRTPLAVFQYERLDAAAVGGGRPLLGPVEPRVLATTETTENL